MKLGKTQTVYVDVTTQIRSNGTLQRRVAVIKALMWFAVKIGHTTFTIDIDVKQRRDNGTGQSEN